MERYIVGISEDQALLLLRVLGGIKSGQLELEDVGYPLYEQLNEAVSKQLQRCAGDAAYERFPTVYFDAGTSEPKPEQPPIDNDFVEDGCEQFGEAPAPQQFSLDYDVDPNHPVSSFKRLLVTRDGAKFLRLITGRVRSDAVPGSYALYNQITNVIGDEDYDPAAYPGLWITHSGNEVDPEIRLQRQRDDYTVADEQEGLGSKVGENAYAFSLNEEQLRYVVYASGVVSEAVVPGSSALHAAAVGLLDGDDYDVEAAEFPHVHFEVASSQEEIDAARNG